MTTLSRMTAVWTLLGVTGCAGLGPTSPPTASLSDAEKALQQAYAADAAEFATLEVQMAEDKLEQAVAIVESEQQGQLARSRRLAEQAEVDAQLAIVKAETERLHQLRRRLAETLEMLRDGRGETEP